jgi:hypothetical protein
LLFLPFKHAIEANLPSSKDIMEDILQKRLKEHEALVRAKASRSHSPTEASSPRSVWSRESSLDLKRKAQNEVDDYSFSDYSFYSDSPLKEKFQPTPKYRRKSRLRRYALYTSAALGITILFIYYIVSVSQQHLPPLPRSLPLPGISHSSYFSELYSSGKAKPGVYPYEFKGTLPTDRCSICNCDVTPNIYEPAKASVEYAPRARYEDVYRADGSVELNEFMRQTILDVYCSRQHLSSQQAYKLARRTGNNLHEMMSWSLASLELGKPTVYLTTATSPNGKAGIYRPQFFRRHGREVRTWIKQQEAKAKADHPGWQVVWIIAEDEVDIDPQVIQTLRRTGVPYVYFSYGLTKSWGNAQKNAAMQVAYALSRPTGGIFGHGPVYGLDDDNKILHNLLDLLVKVERVGVFPIGNLGAYGFEEPEVDSAGQVVGSGSLWQPLGRKFPFDFGGFAFNTSLLGPQIPGPMFWKHQDFAGESEFLGQIVSQFSDLEPLCGRQTIQDCHYVWHNEPLLSLEKMTDLEESKYIEKYGIEKYQQNLESQTRERDSKRGAEYVRPDGIRPGQTMEGIPEMTENGVEIVWVEVQA